ncbi:MAG: response regulator [Candidatus Margulisiibacteriota bacterium]
MDILLVEDNEDQTELFIERLKALHLDIHCVRSGEEALYVLQNDKPKMVFLDIMLPKVDGYEICRKIKANPLTKHLPVIFITALNVPRQVDKCFDVGGDEVLMKPFKNDSILSIIQKYIH